MEERFRQRGRTMTPNNRKQALLPAGAEMLDNAVGTACGFAVDIGKARFYFTPGVPRELYRMLEEQVLPRLLARSGQQTAIYLKRFHSYGLGESHVDEILKGVEALAPDGSVKLGFRTHYPQLETKLTVRGKDMDDIQLKLAPVVEEVRKRLGNFIIAEDDQTLAGVVLAQLTACHGSLALVETYTGGQIAARLAPLPGAEAVFRRGIVARTIADLSATVGLPAPSSATGFTLDMATQMATIVRQQADATHALAVLVDVDEGPDRNDLGGTICLAVSTAQGIATRHSRIAGGREWVRLGAVEMGLDSIRRYLLGLPVDERIDFERIDQKR
jgi:nicotinamide-nucleotide amidase